MIQVTIATQQHRSHNIQKIVDAINEQTVKPDRIALILQGYMINVYSQVELVTYFKYENEGAIARFYHLCDDINLIIDDDFIPSKDYIKTALDGLDRNPNAFCSFWGFQSLPSKEYLTGWKNLPSWECLPLDYRCIRVGCGLSIWDERKVRIKNMVQNHKNFNDMQVAIYCANNNIPMYCLAHNENIAEHLGDDKSQSRAIWKMEESNAEFLQELHTNLLTIFES